MAALTTGTKAPDFELKTLDGKPFVLRDFMDRFNNEGMIPVPLMEEEMISTEARER